jgi:hypothetical protein
MQVVPAVPANTADHRPDPPIRNRHASAGETPPARRPFREIERVRAGGDM